MSSLGRAGFTWITLLFTLQSDQALRPIDQIEGAPNRDRKIATYKLALFRALCDIALTNYRWLQAKVDLPSRGAMISNFLGSMTWTSDSPAKNDVIRTLLMGVVHLT